MYDSVRWIRNASSSGGCSRRSEWQWLSTIGIASRSIGTRDGSSVLEEVVVELVLLVLRRVRRGLGPTDLQVLRREAVAQRRHQHTILLELVERLRRRQRDPPDSAGVALCIGQVARILVDRLARVEPALDAVERRPPPATTSDVRG